MNLISTLTHVIFSKHVKKRPLKGTGWVSTSRYCNDLRLINKLILHSTSLIYEQVNTHLKQRFNITVNFLGHWALDLLQLWLAVSC